VKPLSHGPALGWPKNNAGSRRGALVLDADRTLGLMDTGREVGSVLGLNARIRAMFERLGYTVEAFARHAEMWSAVPTQTYIAAIEEVAPRVRIHESWLRVFARARDVPTVVVTAGIPQLWENVLEHYGVGHIPVLGGLHSALDTCFVTPRCKAWVVRGMQRSAHFVVAAGDSEIDLEMLTAADLGLFVADRKGSPRLLRRVSNMAGVRHFVTDERRFPPLPPIHADELLDRLLKE